jgi:hypothetical protein
VQGNVSEALQESDLVGVGESAQVGKPPPGGEVLTVTVAGSAATKSRWTVPVAVAASRPWSKSHANSEIHSAPGRPTDTSAASWAATPARSG